MSRFIVATLHDKEWLWQAESDDLQQTRTIFESLLTAGSGEAIAIFTRRQWEGNWQRSRYFQRITDDTGYRLPPSVGLWLVNQADSGYF